jgi:paraquat-inducible protein B
MSRQANPALIGIFVLGAFILGVITLLLLSGGQWFQDRRQHILYFEGAAQGLQVGAPVVLLGVKVGTVKQIQLALMQDGHTFLVPVTIEIEPAVVQASNGEQVDLGDPETLRKLIERGLRAQLRMQSLLTGQLYISLNFYPDQPLRRVSDDPELSEIPTIPTAVEKFSLQLEDFPLDKFLQDVASISASMSKILAADETAELPQRLNRTLQHLESLAKKLDQESMPVLQGLRADIAVLGEALASLKNAADQVSALTDPSSPLFKNLTRASEELAGAALAVKKLSSEGSPTAIGLYEMLQEVAYAAHAIRILAETLEQHPQSIFWGKPALREAPDR